MRDSYEVLGLSPGVSEAEIKRAFRQLAMRWHPDRNADPAAAERFNTLRSAYETLLANFSPLSEKNPANRASAASAARGADRWMDLELSIEDVFRGVRREVRVRDEIECSSCDGSGTETLGVSRLCAPCRGSGRLRVDGRMLQCADCNGRGYRNTAACEVCGGSGHCAGERRLEVQVPAGMVDGDVLRLNGEGDPATEAGAPRGALHLRIRLAPHPLFHRSGRDLLLQRPVSALRMLLGGAVRVPHPSGTRSVNIAAGDAQARSVRLAGAGFPARSSKPAGDFVVALTPTLPRTTDSRLRKLLAQLEAELAEDPARYLPELAHWEAQWLD